jgi:SAM-dependent methyltransferase
MSDSPWQNPFPMVEVAACNLCGATSTETVYEGPDRLLRHAGWFRVVQCRRCGLLYQNPRPANIGPFYEGDYGPFQAAQRCFAAQPAADAVAEPEAATERDTAALGAARAYERLLQQAVPGPPGRLLDVGCATGDFVLLLASRGWQVAGNDLSAAAVAQARRRLAAYPGAELHNGPLSDAPFAAASFDVVTIWHTIEHLPDPRVTLCEVWHLLRPGGTLLIQTPAWLSLESRLWGPYWSGYDCPRHFYLFSHRTLYDLLEQTGFEPRRWLVHTSYYLWIISLIFAIQDRLPPELVYRLYTLLHQRWCVRLFKPFFRVIDWGGQGSHLTVVAVKR